MTPPVQTGRKMTESRDHVRRSVPTRTVQQYHKMKTNSKRTAEAEICRKTRYPVYRSRYTEASVHRTHNRFQTCLGQLSCFLLTVRVMGIRYCAYDMVCVLQGSSGCRRTVRKQRWVAAGRFRAVLAGEYSSHSWNFAQDSNELLYSLIKYTEYALDAAAVAYVSKSTGIVRLNTRTNTAVQHYLLIRREVS